MVAQIKGSENGLELPIFWGIRFTVISLAINPFLYGLLARQYRLAYVYVLRKIFSVSCFCCVKSPLKNIFGNYSNLKTLNMYVYYCTMLGQLVADPILLYGPKDKHGIQSINLSIQSKYTKYLRTLHACYSYSCEKCVSKCVRAVVQYLVHKNLLLYYGFGFTVVSRVLVYNTIIMW